jgi:hypothetical protein
MSTFEEVPVAEELAAPTYPAPGAEDDSNKRDRDDGTDGVEESLKKAKMEADMAAGATYAPAAYAPPVAYAPPALSYAGASTTAVGADGQTLLILEVAPDKVGQIIGSKGMVIMDIQTRTGARAYVNQDFPEGVNRQVNISMCIKPTSSMLLTPIKPTSSMLLTPIKPFLCYKYLLNPHTGEYYGHRGADADGQRSDRIDRLPRAHCHPREQVGVICPYVIVIELDKRRLFILIPSIKSGLFYLEHTYANLSFC